MTLELFLAAALAAGPAGEPTALQEQPLAKQDEGTTTSAAPRADDEAPVWFWFSTCEGPLMALEVVFDEQAVFETRFPVCQAPRSSPYSQGQDTRISFVFTPTRPIEWRGYRDEPDTSSANEPLRIDLWEAGADPDALIIGVSAMGSDRIYMNTLHIAVLDRRRVSEVTEGLTVATFPETTARPERAALTTNDDDSTRRQWALATTEEISWEDAAAACEALEFDGATDWRLPRIEELTLHSSTIPAELHTLLEDRQIDAWACNPLEETRPETIGGEAKGIARLEAEERELERKLCELEGGLNCSRPHRWKYSFEWDVAHHGRLAGGSALCVRGPGADCQPIEPSAFRARCVTTVRPSNRWEEPYPGVVIEGIRPNGSRVLLGRSNEQGVLCLPEDEVPSFALIMACAGGGCGAIAPGRSSSLLFVDEPSMGKNSRKKHLCLSLQESRTDTPVCGAQIEGVLDTGAIAQFGETGPRGRQCVRRKRLEDVEILLACVSGTCRAVPRGQFGSSREIVLSLPPFYSSRIESKGACPAAREHGIPRIEPHHESEGTDTAGR